MLVVVRRERLAVSTVVKLRVTDFLAMCIHGSTILERVTAPPGYAGASDVDGCGGRILSGALTADVAAAGDEDRRPDYRLPT